jgi:hypothetical protein
LAKVGLNVIKLGVAWNNSALVFREEDIAQIIGARK